MVLSESPPPHDRWIGMAIELAVNNVLSGHGGPFGAVVVRDGTLISEGTNVVTTQNDPTAHAEIVAIRRACEVLGTFELRDCVIYTSCEPCPMCLGAIYWARMEAVYFAATHQDASKSGFDDSFIYEEMVRPIAARKLKMIQVPLQGSNRSFEAWKAQPNRVND